jgi:predicted O-linked N-acetylglucosamine transferase (SPINDLY family)
MPEALRLLKWAASLNKNNAAAFSNLGNVLNDLGHYDEAFAAFSKAIKLKPDFTTALNNRANCLQSLNRLEEALADAQQSIKIIPSFHDGFVSIGNICNRMQRYEESVQAYQAALQLRPNNPQTLSNLGASLMDSHRYKESEIVLNEALKINPQFVQALNNRANLYTSIKRPEAALADINAALQFDPRFIEAYLNRGNILQDLNRIPESLTSYDKALEMNPQYAAAFNNKGNALKEIFQNKAALACYDQAITIQPAYAEAHYHRALALNEFQRYEEATAAFEKAVELKEDHPLLFGQWISSLMMICDWRDLPPKVARLSAKIRAGKNASTTFSILSCGVAPDLVKQSAQAFIQDKCWDRSQEYVYPSPHTNPRIRVGYFSSDFRNHAVSQLAVGLFENHDREKFEVFGFNISTLPPDEMTQRVAQAFGGLVELGSLSIRQSIEKIRSMNIDIAIDLNGHTKGAKMDIFAHRIAPIQVNYLGYPGTSGAPFMDYILGDQVIIPEDHFGYYTEKVAHLPGSYLPNDSKKVISEKTPTRGEAGLPEGAFVFCCFNNSYKFHAETFDVWLRLLQRVPGSVLWLSQVNEKAAQNLCARATSQGIEPTRLVFAPRTKDLADHLARHRLADLFLDTTRYNAHTTASDALWAGLPVLTCLGDSFPGRVAASLLSAMDMPELITHSLEQYESLAFELATNPDKMASVKNKLSQNRSTRPLFDTVQFAKGMESVFAKMWNRHTQGLPPDHLPHEQRPARVT